MKVNQKHDNVKFYFRPLECKLKKTYFLDMEKFGAEETFDKNCVDLENGDSKPQIRVHGRALFNVTNLMHFENLEFTGEDNSVRFSEDLYLPEDIAKNQDFFDSSPFTFCRFDEEPYTRTIHTAKSEAVENMSSEF